jgi:polyhydroxybutyrate depolymerase
VACAYSGRVAAIAPVAGVTAITPCPLSRPVPVIAFHGTADGYLAYDGGLGPKALALPAPDGSGRTLAQLGVKGGGPSVPQIMSIWAGRDGCGTTPGERAVASDVTLLSYPCRGHVQVELYRVQGGGHAWPGSAVSALASAALGHTTMSISANALIWAFFVAHPLGS